MTKIEALKKAWDNTPLETKKKFCIISKKNTAYMSKFIVVGCKKEKTMNEVLKHLKEASEASTKEAIEINKLIQKL